MRIIFAFLMGSHSAHHSPPPPPPPRPQVPVVEGAHKSLRGVAKERIADFVHGTDGFGNTNPQLSEVGGRWPCCS